MGRFLIQITSIFFKLTFNINEVTSQLQIKVSFFTSRRDIILILQLL